VVVDVLKSEGGMREEVGKVVGAIQGVSGVVISLPGIGPAPFWLGLAGVGSAVHVLGCYAGGQRRDLGSDGTPSLPHETDSGIGSETIRPFSSRSHRGE
jgi:hypothetical protein